MLECCNFTAGQEIVSLEFMDALKRAGHCGSNSGGLTVTLRRMAWLTIKLSSSCDGSTTCQEKTPSSQQLMK